MAHGVSGGLCLLKCTAALLLLLHVWAQVHSRHIAWTRKRHIAALTLYAEIIVVFALPSLPACLFAGAPTAI
jgi:hypothetical protein